MLRFTFLSAALVLLFSACNNEKAVKESSGDDAKPNIIIVYVDDLGYGDVSCYGATAVETPNIDKLAAGGVKFTDAHCPSSTCTPSRYSLLTGEYAFRNNAAILDGDAPLLIDTEKVTLPDVLKRAGYKTGVVGKWHLGLGDGNLNWNDSIKPGPLEIGFDYSFLIPATGDRVPSVYVENYSIVGLDPNDPVQVNYKTKVGEWPTGLERPDLCKQIADTQHAGTITNGVPRIGFQSGGEAALWVDEDMPDLLVQKSKDFIAASKDQPFFLYLAYHDIHVPRVPHERFVGKTNMGPRGDAIVQMDWCTGEVVKYLEELGLAENTLIVFSSDNGPVLDDGYADQSVELLGDHKPAGQYRGGKYSAFEAGTRVPTIAYWPETITPKESKALLSHIDLYASIAELVGQDLADNEGVDSEALLNTWLGENEEGREFMLEESFVMGLRKGNWKYIPASNAWSGWIDNKKKIESGITKEAKLYDLNTDAGEKSNVAEQNSELVQEMDSVLRALVPASFLK